MNSFSAFLVTKEGKTFSYAVTDRTIDDLPAGEVIIDVRYSSLNYKDALSAIGNPGVTRNFPHTPGIDAAGVVYSSAVPEWKVGDEVIVTGYDLGMNTAGGFGQKIRVPAEWILRKPAGLTLRETMILGTAGLTAGLCVDKLEHAGLEKKSAVLVTGSTGGVGCIAVNILARMGMQVTAVTGKMDKSEWLKELGATEVIHRDKLREGSARPLLAEHWGGIIDTVGGDILANAIKSLRYGASVAVCGLVNSPEIPITVLPFILRNVNLLGIDSVVCSRDSKYKIWERLAGEWQPDNMESLVSTLELADLATAIERILHGKMVGRGLVCL